MASLRRTIASLAVLLTLVVGSEATDLVPCADEAGGIWSLLVDLGADASDTVPHGPAPTDTAPDCLCHVPCAEPVRLGLSKADCVLQPLTLEHVVSLQAVAVRVPTPPPRA